MLIKLSDIFTPNSSKKRYSKETLLQLEIKTEFVEGLAKSLKLLHLEETSTENNLCYAFNGDINLNYKLGLSQSDIRNHLKATLQPIEYNIETDTIQFTLPFV
ncbi:hypothetical protein [Muricauda sp. MAR_2010_75]|jgi:hypothetical protein|uniref:hypothetical protein n=1 Tax=Allomuricauda sp. MAR_2010_75 TaxID=1250232 RepID=UPI000563BD31|nr:hypothetical protein [Muricauda sp. MAR_2010_75]